MTRLKIPLSALCSFLLFSGLLPAQDAVRIDNPAGGAFGWLLHPYQARSVPPVNLRNTTRLESLIRAGNLYLSAQDVIDLALENNLDIEIQRYGPLLSKEVSRRAQSGGVLRSVGVGVAQGPQSVSLTGVSLNASGGATTTAAAGVSSSGQIVTNLGPALLNLDPQTFFYTNFQHSTSPQSNTVLTGTTALIAQTRTL